MKKQIPTYQEAKLIAFYKKLRAATVGIEQLIEDLESADCETFSDQDLHRLDKAVVVSKVGFKMVKMILKTHGFKGLKAEAMKEEIKNNKKETD